MSAHAIAVAPPTPLKTGGGLRLERISKTYTKSGWFGRNRTEVHALRGVSFAVGEGETVGLLGPNGAGKTTLLKIIANLIYPTEGRVTLLDYDAGSHPLEVRRMTGLVTCDERSFYWRLTGRQNLNFFATLYGIPAATAAARIDLLFETLGLTHAADRRYQGYSSGMKQKMAIARGLLGDPRLVLYDEPTRSLDPLSARNIRSWISAEKSKSPRQIRILATNQLQEAEQLCDRVVIINRGQIIAQGTVREIHEQWARKGLGTHRIAFRGWRGSLTPRAGFTIDEEEPADDCRVVRIRVGEDSDALSFVLSQLLDAGAQVVRCETVRDSFDEVFCSMLEAPR